jgi:hypothetical protein
MPFVTSAVAPALQLGLLYPCRNRINEYELSIDDEQSPQEADTPVPPLKTIKTVFSR